MIPDDRKYTKDHEWVKIENGIATIGITDYAQRELGDIVFCDLPQVGAKFDAGDAFAVIESVKAASDIYCAVAGVVERVNEALLDNPEKLNEAAYDEYIAAVRVASADESALLSAAEYEALIAEGA